MFKSFSTMRNFATVFNFEYVNYIKSKSYITVTVFMVIIAIILPCIPTIIGVINSTKDADAEVTDSKSAVIIDQTGLYSSGDIAKDFSGYLFEESPREEAMDLLSEGKLAFIMEITEPAKFNLYISKMNLSQFDLISAATDALEKVAGDNLLTAKGLSENDIAEMRGIMASGEIITVTGGDDSKSQNGTSYLQKIMYAYILIFVLYMTLMLYGQYIVTTIVSEKSSKAMELLVTSTKALNLMFGKVFGVGAAGLTQFAFMLAGAITSFYVNSMFWPKLLFDQLGVESISEMSGLGGMNEMIAMIMTPIEPAILIYLIVFFIFGFFIYAFMYAAFASTAGRIESANTVQTVPMFFAIASFLVAMLGLTNPGGTLIVVCSYIPFMTPMVMFMRICTDSVSSTGAAISVAVLILSVFVIGYLSAKIYRVGILLYGKPPKPLEILKLLIKAKV